MATKSPSQVSELIDPFQNVPDAKTESQNSSSIEEEVISLDLSEDLEGEGNHPSSVNEVKEKIKSNFLKSYKARVSASNSVPHIRLS